MFKRLACFGLLVLALVASDGLRVWAVQDGTTFEQEMDKGKSLMRRRQYDEALKSFKRANELRDRKCAECYGWMSEAYLGLEAYKNVITSSDRVIEFAAGDNQLLLKAYNNKGLALQTLAERKDQSKLQLAEAIFRMGLALQGSHPIIHYNLGVTLLQLNRVPEGIAELKVYLQQAPKGSYGELARKLIDNPRRARENFAPDFSFTSSEGEYVTLEDLRGKVVVLDFWATWCGPCRESVPELRNLYKRYSNQPFVLIGISSDHDAQAWRSYIADERMVWPQYRDENGKIMRAFNVRAFPTYVIIDHEGIVQYQSIGMSWQRAASLENAVRKYTKIVAKSNEVR
jgi:thiol-disulfide isomerase/thioredoxin